MTTKYETIESVSKRLKKHQGKYQWIAGKAGCSIFFLNCLSKGDTGNPGYTKTISLMKVLDKMEEK